MSNSLVPFVKIQNHWGNSIHETNPLDLLLEMIWKKCQNCVTISVLKSLAYTLLWLGSVNICRCYYPFNGPDTCLHTKHTGNKIDNPKYPRLPPTHSNTLTH